MNMAKSGVFRCPVLWLGTIGYLFLVTFKPLLLLATPVVPEKFAGGYITRDAFAPGAVAYNLPGDEWCVTPGYTISFQLQDVRSVKNVCFSLRQFAGKAVTENECLPLERRESLFVLTSCKIWAYLAAQKKGCTADMSITVFDVETTEGRDSENVGAMFSITKVNEKTEIPGSAGFQFGVFEPGIAFETTANLCEPNKGPSDVQWTVPSNTPGEPPIRCIPGVYNPGTKTALFFADLIPSTSSDDPDNEYLIQCKGTMTTSVAPPSGTSGSEALSTDTPVTDLDDDDDYDDDDYDDDDDDDDDDDGDTVNTTNRPPLDNTVYTTAFSTYTIAPDSTPAAPVTVFTTSPMQPAPVTTVRQPQTTAMQPHTTAMQPHTTAMRPTDNHPKTKVGPPTRPWWVNVFVTRPYWYKYVGTQVVIYDITGFNWCTLPGYAMFFTFKSKITTAKVSVSLFVKGSARPLATQLSMPMQLARSGSYYTIDSCQLWSIMKDAEHCPSALSVRVSGLNTLNIDASFSIRRVRVVKTQEVLIKNKHLSVKTFPIGAEVVCSNPASCTTHRGPGRFYWVAPPTNKRVVPQCSNTYGGAGFVNTLYFQDLIKTELVIGKDDNAVSPPASGGAGDKKDEHKPGKPASPKDKKPETPKGSPKDGSGDATPQKPKENEKPTTRPPKVDPKKPPSGGPIPIPRPSRPSVPLPSISVAAEGAKIVSARTPEFVFQSGITATKDSSTPGQTSYTYALPFLTASESLRGAGGPFVLSFCLQGFIQTPSTVKYTIGGSDITLTQGLASRDSEICYRVSSCHIWEILSSRKAPESHTLHVIAPPQTGASPVLSVAQTTTTPIDNPATTKVAVTSGVSDSLELTPGIQCQFQLSEDDLTQKVFQYNKPTSSADLPTCSKLSSGVDRALRTRQSDSSDLIYFPNPVPGSSGQKENDLPIIFTNLECSAQFLGFKLNTAIVLLTVMVLLASYRC